MPSYSVDSDRTAETSSSLISEFEEFQERLEGIKSKVDGLLEDGYNTPGAEKDFKPFFEQFHQGFKDVNNGLEGIGKYVKQVGDSFQSTDEELGKGLSG
ncbi:WXG100 family type VII secretion target [Salinactinospora qingdaonensis]|uniref:Proteins of 100 residues with WXG n=1 Tax=Salinactinospora qingdaonensis TaxID=702744 RepID=A0ABP7F606_9ACTN